MHETSDFFYSVITFSLFFERIANLFSSERLWNLGWERVVRENGAPFLFTERAMDQEVDFIFHIWDTDRAILFFIILDIENTLCDMIPLSEYL